MSPVIKEQVKQGPGSSPTYSAKNSEDFVCYFLDFLNFDRVPANRAFPYQISSLLFPSSPASPFPTGCLSTSTGGSFFF